MKKKLVLLAFCLMQISFCVFSETGKGQIPGFFDVRLDDSKSEVFSKLQERNFMLMGESDGAYFFASAKAKFGEVPVDMLIASFKDDLCSQLALGFNNENLSMTRCKLTIIDYFNGYSDVEAKEINKLGTGGIFSHWIVSKKYEAYFEEQSGGKTFFTVFDRELMER